MQKYIHRKLSFSAQELKEIIVARLQERDRPYPAPSACDVKFVLTTTGAELQWAEDCEENL